MKRRIVGFGVDEAADRFALLECGHRQHVRHKPPFVNRAWTLTEAGRRRMLGRTLNCVLCNQALEDWFALSLGDALTADSRLSEIETACRDAFGAAGNSAAMAALKRHDTEASLHCEVTVYFSPAAAAVAERFGAWRCPRPRRAHLDLLAG
ncbi:MAG TPA: DUF3565 domain-containing protein, partial [Steroidobacter sp.]|nr:DUF3565 domain-containing protein [Steroidobacter sp.]